MLTNIFGDMALDSSVRSIIRKLMNFSFATDSSLRISGPVTVSSGTVTTVSTVTTVTTVGTMTTGNIGFGDQGKTSAAILMSANMFYGSVGRNFGRTKIGEF